MLLAHLSDTHLLADPTAQPWGHDTTERLCAVLEALPRRVDALVVTGDIAEDGAPAAYERALALTAGRAARRHFVPGNHDDREAMHAVFGSAVALEMVRLSRYWSLALVNSQWVGHEAGRVGQQTLARLRDELGATDANVVVCLHHPPLSPCADPDCGLADSEVFWEAIEDRPVRVVLSGHVHQAFDTTRRAVRYLGAPSTFRQLRHGGEPHYCDTGEPPAGRVIELLDDGSIRSRIVVAATD